jgi:LmbE family N-acetylglucosaminyl deacetylase
MTKPTVFKKAFDYWKRRSFRRHLYRKSQMLQPSEKVAVVFSPHQDDETLGCGGVIALKRQQNIPVWVVFLTDGSACYTGAPGPIPMSIEECVQTRRHEAIKALETLGVNDTNVVFLNHQDSTLGQYNLEQREQVIQELRELLQKIQPQEVFVPYFRDMHGDHIQTFRLVKDALKEYPKAVDLWQYLIWSLWCYEYLDDLPKQQFANLYKVSIDKVREQKQRALKAYQSQFFPIVNNFSALPKTFLSFFNTPFELFVKVPDKADEGHNTFKETMSTTSVTEMS